jgi:prevent-host-death family protein
LEFAIMSEVPVSVFRERLHTYLARARRGERVQVTSHGKVIAELVPPATPTEPRGAVLARLRGSVLGYDQPFEPVGLEDWDALG